MIFLFFDRKAQILSVPVEALLLSSFQGTRSCAEGVCVQKLVHCNGVQCKVDVTKVEWHHWHGLFEGYFVIKNRSFINFLTIRPVGERVFRVIETFRWCSRYTHGRKVVCSCCDFHLVFTIFDPFVTFI